MMDIAASRFEIDEEEAADEGRAASAFVTPDDALAGLLPIVADLAADRVVVEGPASPPVAAVWAAEWQAVGQDHRLALSRSLVANLVAVRCGGAPAAALPPEPGGLEAIVARRIAAAIGSPEPRLARLTDLGPGWRIGLLSGALGELWREVRLRQPEPTPEERAALRAAERHRLAQTPLELCVEIAALRLPLARIEAFDVGTVLPLLALDRLTLTCSGRRIARAAHVEGAAIRTVRIEATP